MNKKMKFLIIDRLTRARDNGEYFYRYLQQYHPEIEILFGLHHDSDDWMRLLNDKFNLVDLADNKDIQSKLKNCTHFLFSEANLGYKSVSSFLNRNEVTYIYLNHGCYFQKKLVCYPYQKFDYMICGNKAEYDAVLYNAKQNNWPTDNYWLTGFPRMDEQTRTFNSTKEKNLIIIQPWWRENLTSWKLVEKNNKIDKNCLITLQNSLFIQGFNELLNNEEFQQICKNYKLQVVFKRHPVMEHIPGVFNVPDWIIDEPNELFIDLFAKTKLYITDYSSNAWELANLGVPCIYFEPDYINLITNCHRPEQCWNIKTQGLGPVAFNVKEFLQYFKKLIENNFQLTNPFIERRKEQIVFLRDTNNCQRCYNEIIKHYKNQRIIVTMTSWYARIQNVTQVLQSVLKQSIQPDHIYLNLSKEEFTQLKLPQDLEELVLHNPLITLNWVEGKNTKPFKKIFPILKYCNDNDIIINIDDDMLLPSTFIESRIRDFNKYKTCISGLQSKTINGYGGGLLPEVQHYLGAGSVYQKKMLNHWDEILNDEIINTNHDDAFYCFLVWLNGWLPVNCSEFDSHSLEVLSEIQTAIHGDLGCLHPKTVTQINIKRFQQVFKKKPCYNFFKTNKIPSEPEYPLWIRQIIKYYPKASSDKIVAQWLKTQKKSKKSK